MKTIQEVTYQPQQRTRKELRSARTSRLAASLCVLLLGSGCKDDSGNGEGEDGSSGQPEENCDACDLINQSNYFCACDPNGDGVSECTPGVEDCGTACLNDATACTPVTGDCAVACGFGVAFHCSHTTCINEPNSGTCSSWSPASHITLSSGVYHVGGSWLAGVVSNPAPIWTCDDAYFLGNAGAGFTLKSAVSGDLLYVLGLRTNDIPLTINGLPLNTWRDAMHAAGKLYFSGVTSYTLTVKRSGSSITLSYQIV